MKIAPSQIKIRLSCEPAYEHPSVGSADPEFLSAVEELMEISEWGWCDVEVSATAFGLTARAYLGGCSYRSAHDFIQCDSYTDLVSEATSDLETLVDQRYREICAYLKESGQ